MNPDPGALPPRDPEQEAALAANPDDKAAYQAYGRWLTERGDPHGPLISFAFKHEKGSTLEAEYAAATRRVDPCDFFQPVWRRGFVDRAACLSEYEAMDPESFRHYPSSEEVTAFLESREACVLRDLVLVDTQSKSPCQILLAMPRPPPLRRLVITTHDDPASMTALWARLPQLRALHVTCLTLGDLVLPELESLTLRASVTELGALSNARVPKLQELFVQFGLPEDAGPDALAATLPTCPGLRKFRWRHEGDAGQFLTALLHSALLPKVTTLDLSMARFPEGGQEVLRVVEGGRLDHLRSLDVGPVATSKTFPDETVRRLRDRLKERLKAW